MFVCKKRLVLFTSLLFLSIGGMMMFGFHCMSEEEKLQAQIRKEQERMVLYAVNHYEGIEKIEFVNFEKDNKTGTWDSDAIINDKFHVTFVSWGEDDITINGGKSQTGDYLVPKVATTVTEISDIQVKYYKELP
ncbi:hypothetical protein HO551_10090 [Streptococcus suis]|nr:hypothetical protein [Streptococcus suis]MBS8086146.1 hypothetical protein [Streptococcus suis]NQJ51104.1 hypothetical protein [Streptococcus suis]NQJ53210.1 hypothetical protein [Streptococcus suis]NQJ57592.1 hypothetical protein [Streptococcus suis]HEM2813366.1 hypothetical protein [Streptococcus suis]